MVQMREVALLEAQQILRAVATASPASLLEDEAPQATSTRSLGAAQAVALLRCCLILQTGQQRNYHRRRDPKDRSDRQNDIDGGGNLKSG
jgi:hypothetical protein